jgi:hypothetical protein
MRECAIDQSINAYIRKFEKKFPVIVVPTTRHAIVGSSCTVSVIARFGRDYKSRITLRGYCGLRSHRGFVVINLLKSEMTSAGQKKPDMFGETHEVLV